MNEIQRLIHEMCPEGVPMVAFDSCATYTRGITYNKKQESDPKDPSANKILRANNITLEVNSLNFNDIKFVKSEVKIRQDQWLKAGDILICAGSGSKEHIGKVAYINEDIKYSFGGFMAVIRPQSNTISRYLYHNLLGRTFKDYLSSALNSTTINNLNSSVMNGYEIPLPPLPIQQRIVEILDKFTSLVSSLDSEIALRQKQYEFAGERIFCSIYQHYQWIPLGDVCEVFDGVHQTPEYVEKGIRFVSVENIDDIYGSNKYITEDAYNKYKNKPKVGDVFMTRITAGVIGQCAIVDKDEPLAYYVSLALLRPKKDISSRYLRAYLHSSTGKKELRKWIKVDATPTKINKGDINKVLILVPSLDKQQRIVRTLDTFESLLTNLKKERELRQKQYEYYREKLLTFA